jgi:hypothetical protein
MAELKLGTRLQISPHKRPMRNLPFGYSNFLLVLMYIPVIVKVSAVTRPHHRKRF